MTCSAYGYTYTVVMREHVMGAIYKREKTMGVCVEKITDFTDPINDLRIMLNERCRRVPVKVRLTTRRD